MWVKPEVSKSSMRSSDPGGRGYSVLVSHKFSSPIQGVFNMNSELR